jgi:hypothetical protein
MHEMIGSHTKNANSTILGSIMSHPDIFFLIKALRGGLLVITVFIIYSHAKIKSRQ